MSESTMSDLARLRSLRRRIVKMAEHSAHVGVSLSCVDMLAALFFGVLEGSRDPRVPGPRDAFILSKGHGAMALYAVLAEAGVIDAAELDSYGCDGSFLAEHPLAGKLAGVEFATGSLGHGLAIGVGLARGYQLQGDASRVYVLLGDGECDEGAVWEAAGAASAQRLGRLTALIDCNGLQACGRRCDISGGTDLPACWRGFGWRVEEVDGHDFAAVQALLLRERDHHDAPLAVICHTVKGKGLAFMESDLEWHYRPVRGADRDTALELLADA